ncbi:MAG: ABC transporter ATP-binding protein [Pseudomonadota bacterium]
MVLSCAGLSLGYPGHVVARDLSFSLHPGEVTAVIGHNGSGKTTLIKTVLGVNAPAAGSLYWTDPRPREIGYLAQLTEFDRRFPIRVRELAAMGAWRGLGFWGGVDEAARVRIAAALKATGVEAIAEKPLHQLSGGQLQRALFARVIVQNAPVVLLDEPFAAVDQTTEAQLLELISQWAAEGRAVILVVHDLSSVLESCSHALLLGDGSGHFGTVEEVVTPENLVQYGYYSASQAAWFERASARHSAKAKGGVDV